MADRELSAEITLPKSREQVIFLLVLHAIVLPTVVLAILNVVHGVALPASVLGLGLVTLAVGAQARKDGGIRAFVRERLGELIGRDFVEVAPAGEPGTLRLGCELFGRRTIHAAIALDRIETIAWTPGQATSMAGRDMADWSVHVFHDHRDAAKSEWRRSWGSRTPDQDQLVLGSPLPRTSTEPLGFRLVALLRESGVDLVATDDPARFVRRAPAPPVGDAPGDSRSGEASLLR